MNEEEILAKMTLKEKCYFLSGRSFWSMRTIRRLGMDPIILSDGPHGLRRQLGAGDHLGLNDSIPATCFPTAASMANSWNEELMERTGAALGREAVHAGVSVILGPGLNIKRSPLCGRNFEYFSEDPYLSGKMAAAEIRGIQSQGICACAKHFAVNSQETRRMANNSILDERTLREIYLTGFEMAVKEGHVKSVMSAYNMVNGIYCDENPHLLQEILRDEWFFDGFVVSDWGACNNHVLSIRNGSDLTMPTLGGDGDAQLLKAVRKGQIPEAVIDQRVQELLHNLLEPMTVCKEHQNDPLDFEQQHLSALEAAQETVVLLKNEENILPLQKEASAAIIGDFAETPRFQGAGSSLVNATKHIPALQAAEKEHLHVLGFARGYHRNGNASDLLADEAIALAEKADVVLLYLGLNEVHDCEGLDRYTMKLPQNQIRLLKMLQEVNENIVVILSCGGVVEMPWLNECKALLHGYLGGQAGAEAMMEILMGKVNPSGKLAETYPMYYEDTPVYGNWPAEGRDAVYREGLFTGYRYYDHFRKEVRFPFGYGLSYTSFAYSGLQVKEKEVSFCITNTGDRAGSEIAQLYIGMKDSRILRAEKELKGFSKIFLQPGESKKVAIALDDKAFRYFNVHTNRFETEPGIYQVMIGASLEDIRLQAEIMVPGTDAPLPLDPPVLAKPQKEKRSGTLDGDDTIASLRYCRSLLGRMIYFAVHRIYQHGIDRGTPDLNLAYVYNMPFRGLSKISMGLISDFMVQGLLREFNGLWICGLLQFLIGFPVQLIRKIDADRIR